MCVANQVCNSCMGNDEIKTLCQYCGTHEFIFTADPVKELVGLATRKSIFFNRMICISYNARRLDSQFILKYHVENKKSIKSPSVIFRGTRSIVMSTEKKVCLDRLNYLNMPLSVLPKEFELPGIMKKGIFSHLFNIPWNQEYIGPLPDERYYEPDGMSAERRNEFHRWYNEAKEAGQVLDFAKELIYYYILDVEIL